ncbi:MAG: hypothetical protein WD649_00635, partial [Thermoleophilaceae bacterium]
TGAIAGALAAAAWAAIQPLDKQLFRSGYDDVELLGKALTRERWWPAAGLGLHLANGAAFGAVYAQGRPFIPGPPVARGLLAALAENLATWPLTAVSDRYHPARGDLPKLSGDARAFAQATFRHALFGLVLGELERRLNSEHDDEPPPVPVSSNGHGNIEAAVGAA